jgi:hypothetical protein
MVFIVQGFLWLIYCGHPSDNTKTIRKEMGDAKKMQHA